MNHEYYHDENEKRNNKIGWIVSITLHVALILVFIFMIAWRAPDPPLPVYGVEINLGMEDMGSGEIPSTQESVPVDNTNVLEEKNEPLEPVEEAPEDDLVTQEDPAPQEVEKTETKPQPVSPMEKETPKETKVVEKPVEKKEFKPIATYPSLPAKDKKSTGEGDDKDKAGDKGKPDGDPRSKYYTGTPGDGGGGDGASLNMSGWSWEMKPNPKDQSSESGKIVFQIKVDDRGDIVGVTVVEKSVSSEVLQIYKKEVEKLKFKKTVEGAAMPAVSTGTITFIIRSR